MLLKHVVHPAAYLHVSSLLVRLVRLLQPARTPLGLPDMLRKLSVGRDEMSPR